MSAINCTNCGNTDPIPLNADKCPSCGTQIPPPNVRAANVAEELEALNKRYNEALAITTASGTAERLLEFKSTIDTSSAVLCRDITSVLTLLKPNANYSNFYMQLRAGERSPEENRFDKSRQLADQAVFPYYYEEIIFAALTLNDDGVYHYGQCGVVLREDAISHRATVFEGNTTVFCMTHNIGVKNPSIPCGYRAIWKNRGMLACAKLYPSFSKETTENDFSGILLRNDPDPAKDDFVEVNIYGSFSRTSIKSISVRNIKTTPDKVLLQLLKSQAKDLGIEIKTPEIISSKAA